MSIHGSMICRKTHEECEDLKRMHDAIGLATVEQGSLFFYANNLKKALEKIETISREATTHQSIKSDEVSTTRGLKVGLLALIMGVGVGTIMLFMKSPSGLVFLTSGLLVGIGLGIILGSRR